VGFEIPVTVIMTAPAAIPALGALPKGNDKTPPLSEAPLQPTGALEQRHAVQLNPVRVMITIPFLGMELSVVIEIVRITSTADLHDVLSVIEG